MENKKRKFLSLILVVALLIGSFPALIVSADEENEIKNNYDEYNCYAYAIGRFEETKFYWPWDELNPRYQPGDICKINPTYDGYDGNIYTLTTLVQNDLMALGFTNILIYLSDGDDYNINSNEIDTYSQLLDSIDFETQELICVRIATETEYHFMKYDAETNAWYNKIGYGEIFKYIDNNGIPSNNVYWISSNHTYSGDIAYIIYDKLQINVDSSGYSSKNIIIQGCETGYSARDAFYEIVISNSCEYTIQLSTEYSAHNFNYEIYSYNMYNGNYQILAQGSGNSTAGAIATVNLTAYDDYNDGFENWQYQAYRYYIRLDFGRSNTTDQTVNVNISHVHDYTDHYEQNTSIQHEAYCWCGEYKLQRHQLVDGECSLCGELHQHLFSYTWISNVTHQEVCFCGEEGRIKPHVVESDAFSGGAMYATCIVCGGRVSRSPQIILSVNKLPHTENGSYIRPDGIIVLVGEDIEAYLDGMLEFVYPDDNFET